MTHWSKVNQTWVVHFPLYFYEWYLPKRLKNYWQYLTDVLVAVPRRGGQPLLRYKADVGALMFARTENDVGFSMFLMFTGTQDDVRSLCPEGSGRATSVRAELASDEGRKRRAYLAPWTNFLRIRSLETLMITNGHQTYPLEYHWVRSSLRSSKKSVWINRRRTKDQIPPQLARKLQYTRDNLGDGDQTSVMFFSWFST